MPTSAEDTGRIAKILDPVARAILFDRELEDQAAHELPYICRIDQAHVLMLAECGIIDRFSATRLLNAIERLKRQDFAPLCSRAALRGMFLLYENYLIETEGASVGGMLQMARSRNDLNSTLLRLRLRPRYLELAGSMLMLRAILLRKARLYAGVVMPGYTHGQPAEAITYGHYLAGVATAVERDTTALIEAAAEIETCPLGAGAVAGTSVPIDCGRTAEFLGFARCAENSIDAVASRDFVLRLLGAAAVHGATLSRIATDLLQWLTQEFAFLALPDDLVGSSSAMPQKRNPFLLEHVQGRTAAALGAFTQALAATRNVPFTNAISVGTESVRPLWRALRDTTDAATLLRLVVAKALPMRGRMLQRASDGFTNATVMAVRVVQETGEDFRSAHHRVGRAVKEALEKGLASLEELSAVESGALPVSTSETDPTSCVTRAQYGGGPSPAVLLVQLQRLRSRLLDQHNTLKQQRDRWQRAQRKLEQAVQDFAPA